MDKGTQNITQWRWLSSLLAACLGWAVAVAQNPPDLVWGPNWQHPRPDEVLELFGHEQSHFYALTREGSRKQSPIHLHRVDTDSLHVQSSMLIQFPETGSLKPSYHRSLSFGGMSYVISTAINELASEVYFDAWPLTEGMERLQNPIRLATMPSNVLGRTRNYRIEADEAGRHLAVVMPLEFDPARNDKFHVKLYNARLELIYDKQLEVPHPFGEVQYGDMLVDGKAAVYMLMTKPAEGGPELGRVSNPGRDHYLLRYDWEQNTLSEKALSLGVKWIYNAQLGFNNTGQLHIAGYFSNMIDLVMSGTFSVTFHRQSGELINAGLQSFDRSFKAAFRGSGGAERTDLALFHPGYVFPFQEDALMLVSEKREVQSSTMFNPATGTYYTVQSYINDELLLSSITGAGNASLNLRIPKYQSSYRSPADFLSYIAFSCKGPATAQINRVCLIFNDHERNSQLELHSSGRYNVLTSASQAQAIMYQVEPSGQYHKYILFNQSPQKGIFIPSVHYPLNDGVVLLTKGNQSLEFVRLYMRAAE